MNVSGKKLSSARYIFSRHLGQNNEWVTFIEGW